MRNSYASSSNNEFDFMNRKSTEGSNGLGRDIDNEGAYWAENSKVLFQTIREIYASVVDWNTMGEAHQLVVSYYLMDRQGVPENLARAAVHAFNEISEVSFGRKNLKEAKLSLLLKMYMQNRSRVFRNEDIRVLTDDMGRPLTFDQAEKIAGEAGISLRLNPNLYQAIQKGTSDTEANSGVSKNAYGQTIGRRSP